MAIPRQYLNNSPQIAIANLSPLQLAVAYYMDQGQQIPFFINQDFLRQMTTFASSGIITPEMISVPGISVVLQGNDVYVQRRAADCGPDETDRYEYVYAGTKQDLLPNSWSFDGILVRGGSAANGAGGPWGTGGLTSQDPTPNNGVDRQPDIVTNVDAAYGTNVSTSTSGIG